MIKTPSVYEYVSIEHILHELDAGVKSLPAVIPCPGDVDHKLYMYPDANGMWVDCPGNGFHGDVFDVMKRHFNAASIERVLIQLEKTGCIDDHRNIPLDSISKYELTCTKRKLATEFWEECSERMLNRDCDLELAAMLGAPATGDDRWWNGFGRFLGACPKKEFEEMFSKLPQKVSNVILVPYYDVPHRIATIRALFRRSGGVQWVDKHFEHKGGVFMFDTVPVSAPLAVALDDPLLAIRLQHDQMKISSKSLPIVVYNDDTKDWPIWTKRVVFWNDEPTAELFKQTRKLPQATITVPDKTVNQEEILSVPQSWLQYAASKAMPWNNVLKDHLIELDVENAEMLLDELDLRSEEIGWLLDACNSDERKVLRDLMDTGHMVKRAMIGDQKITQRNNSWHYTTSTGKLSPFTNFIFTIDRTVDYGNQGIYYIGQITCGDKTLPFMAPMEKFADNPANWFSYFMIRNDMQHICVHNSWKRRLLNVSFIFASPAIRHTTCTPRVGWTDDRTIFRFPEFASCNGTFDLGDIGIPLPGLPLQGSTSAPINLGTLRLLTEPTDANRYFWALAALVTYNLTAKFYSLKPKKIGIIDSTALCEAFNKSIQLCPIYASNRSISKMNSLLSKLYMHDVPYYICTNTNFKTLATWLDDVTEKNVIVSMDNVEGLTVASDDWLFLPIKKIKDSTTHLFDCKNIIPTIVQLIQLSEEPAIDDPVEEVIRLLCKWAKERIPDIDTSIIEEAKLLIRKYSPAGELKDGEKFLFILFSLIEKGEVGVGKVGFKNRLNDGVYLDTKTVVINRSTLAKLPVAVGMKDIIQALDNGNILQHSTASEIIISRTAWDKLYEQWNTKIIA